MEAVIIEEAMMSPVVPAESGRWPLNQGGRAWMPSLEVRKTSVPPEAKASRESRFDRVRAPGIVMVVPFSSTGWVWIR